MGDLVAPDLAELRAFAARLRVVSADDDAGLGIEWLDAIEALKSVGCAAQAVITDDVATSIRADRKARGLPRADWDRALRRRLRWRAENPRTAAADTSDSRTRWCTRCRTPWPCCRPAG